jgi:hypothetical protein
LPAVWSCLDSNEPVTKVETMAWKQVITKDQNPEHVSWWTQQLCCTMMFVPLTWLPSTSSFRLRQFKSCYPSLSLHFTRSCDVKCLCTAIGDDKCTWIFCIDQRSMKTYRATTCVRHLSLISDRKQRVILNISYHFIKQQTYMSNGHSIMCSGSESSVTSHSTERSQTFQMIFRVK